ncbi:MAG: type II secretion system F family protein [Sphingomonadales bacterium]|jgi:tight adherence protein B|nr:type II secretion system F family protein [Sphingomonadales bacterium]
MDNIQIMILMGGSMTTLIIILLAFSGPATGKAQKRRLEAIRERHGQNGNVIEQHMKRITANRQTTASDATASRFIPNPALLRLRLEKTGKNWTLPRYTQTVAGIAIGVAAAGIVAGAPPILALLVGLVLGLGLPHMVVNFFIGRRLDKFNQRFPDSIELMVRGLRSGLPITETLGVVGSEVPGPTGEEFRAIGDRIKIGKTMEAALQETADKLGTPEFQFFCITLQIQRETGGNLAETLSNLSEVLRKRAQMKLKVAAMSSESKASAYIIGSLPFIVFGMILYINPHYMEGFFSEPRLMMAGGGGLCWMGIGAFIMSRMISFEI